jgi:hypothetical protein
MAFRKLKYEYHESLLQRCQLGPGREITLEIRLNSIWNPDGPQNVNLYFSDIRNFEELQALFEHVQEVSNQQALDEVIGIVCRENERWDVDLARIGNISVKTSKTPREL